MINRVIDRHENLIQVHSEILWLPRDFKKIDALYTAHECEVLFMVPNQGYSHYEAKRFTDFSSFCANMVAKSKFMM